MRSARRLRRLKGNLASDAGVYAVQADSLDPSHPRQWATSLDVQCQLDDLIAGKIKPKTT